MVSAEAGKLRRCWSRERAQAERRGFVRQNLGSSEERRSRQLSGAQQHMVERKRRVGQQLTAVRRKDSALVR